MSKFLSQICRVCGACNAKEPYFCTMMHGVDRKQFARTVKYIVVLKQHSKKKLSELTSFTAFVGIFCNNSDLCKFRTPDCVILDNVIKCYEMFLQQSDIELSYMDKVNIYGLYSGIDLRDVGLRYKVPKNPFKDISKKLKKRINRLVEKAISSVATVDEVTAPKTNNCKKDIKVKQITTSLFFSDDVEWRSKVDKIFGENLKDNEVNNR